MASERSQFCMDCKYIGERGRCLHPIAEQKWNTNVRNNCMHFDGEAKIIDWDKAVPVGYRPSTFSRSG